MRVATAVLLTAAAPAALALPAAGRRDSTLQPPEGTAPAQLAAGSNASDTQHPQLRQQAALAPRTRADIKLAGKQDAHCDRCENEARRFSRLLEASSCPDTNAMYDAMVRSDAARPRDGDYVVMSVGCNRADDLVAFGQRFDVLGRYDAAQWTAALKVANHNESPVPACGVGTDTTGWTTSKQIGSVEVHTICAEPMPANVHLIQETLKLVPKLSGEGGTFTLVPRPFGAPDQVGKDVEFPDCPDAGREDCGIGTPCDCRRVQLQATSVDAYMANRSLPQLDALFVDTEGYDPAVLAGSARLLTQGKIRYVEFEVHEDLDGTPWAESPMTGVVAELDEHGYSCYWMGQSMLTKITGCTHGLEPLYDSAGWSNVACVLRSDPWLAVLDQFDKGGLCEAWPLDEHDEGNADGGEGDKEQLAANPPDCPTAAEVQATAEGERWAVWDVADDPERSACRLDQLAGECGDNAPCQVRPKDSVAQRAEAGSGGG